MINRRFDSHNPSSTPQPSANGEQSRRDLRGVVPGIFTMGNIVCGFISIINIIEGNILTACWFVILAAFLDALDGKVARLAGATSRFGVELDSLADFLSFGVAPAALVYAVKLTTMGKWGWVISVVYIMAASYRLARYNLMANSEEKKNFLGLPVPGAALTLVSYVIFSYEIWGLVAYTQYLVSMIILFAALMVSHVEYDALPDRFTRRADRVKAIIIIALVGALLFKPALALFPLMGLYILSGVLREIARLFSVGVERVRGRADLEGRTEGATNGESVIDGVNQEQIEE